MKKNKSTNKIKNLNAILIEKRNLKSNFKKKLEIEISDLNNTIDDIQREYINEVKKLNLSYLNKLSSHVYKIEEYDKIKENWVGLISGSGIYEYPSIKGYKIIIIIYDLKEKKIIRKIKLEFSSRKYMKNSFHLQLRSIRGTYGIKFLSTKTTEISKHLKNIINACWN